MILPASRFLFSIPFSLLLLAPTLLCSATPSSASIAEGVSSAADLPDSPGAIHSRNSGSSNSAVDPASTYDPAGQQVTGAASMPVTLPRVKFIPAGQRAPRQQPKDKVLLGLRESVTPFSMMAWGFSAGWSHLINSSPNYGVNSEAFAQRLGAAAATGASKEIFSDAVFAPIFHQDPRYYQLGRSHKFLNRAVYAATRPVIGRTDDGKSILNYAGILGTGGSAALNLAYYPDRNRNAPTVMRNWASGLGGSALGYLVSEFGGEVIQALHVSKHE